MSVTLSQFTLSREEGSNEYDWYIMEVLVFKVKMFIADCVITLDDFPRSYQQVNKLTERIHGKYRNLLTTRPGPTIFVPFQIIAQI